MSRCAKCSKIADEALSIQHDVCLHWTHCTCLEQDGEKGSFDKCGNCTGLYQQQPASHLGLASSSSSSSSSKQRRGGEPHLPGNRDYVLHPGKRNEGSVLKSVASWIPGVGSRMVETVENSKNPFFLLQNRVPVEEIMAVNELGLDHFLAVGVEVRDFLQNGYDWDDLKKFEDISRRGKQRALKAVTIGLRASANDFRDYPDAFPVEQVRQDTGFKQSDLCRLFGLTFPEGGGFLECQADTDWDAAMCAQLGLKMGHLKDFGLYYLHQYEQLMSGLSQEDAAVAEKQMGVTKKDIASLIDLQEEEERERIAALEQRRQQIEDRIRRETERENHSSYIIEDSAMAVEIEEGGGNDVGEAGRTFCPPPIEEHLEREKLYKVRGRERMMRHGALIK